MFVRAMRLGMNSRRSMLATQVRSILMLGQVNLRPLPIVAQQYRMFNAPVKASPIFPKDINGKTNEEFSLNVADSAIMRIKFLQLKNKERYAVLKMFVVGGGCSGFSYEFDIISEEEFSRAPEEVEDMLVFEKDGARILSDV